MTLLAADLNDAGITVLGEEAVIYREPGIALLDDDALVTGNRAFSAARIRPRRVQARYWSDLSTDALAEKNFQHLSAADLASHQLEQIWKVAADRGDRVVVAVPAYMGSDKLALFLGMCNEIGIPVVALVDAAIAATRRQYLNAVPVHVDVSLHSALLTRILQSGQVQLESSAIVENSGLMQSYEAWMKTISEAFVLQSRFDPLHTAATEQALLDRMPAWLASASAGGAVTMEIEYQGIRHGAELEALTLIAAAAPIYQRIISQLRTLYRSGETPAIQMTDRAAALPGLAEMLKARVGGEVFMLENAATARGLLARCRDMQPGGAVNLIRQLPWDQGAVTVSATETAAGGGQPTHVLFENTAYAIDGRPLNLGSQAVDGERWIDLQQAMPGVSRRHCSLQFENGQCVVHDFSRYGTFLNGHRVDGSAVLQVGDLLRLGTPGFELQLIDVESGHGA